MSAHEAAESVPLCLDCVDDEGLCVRHEPHVLPQLKEPSWHRDAHSGKYFETGKHVKLSDAGQRVKDRKERRRAKRLARALNGEFTKSRPRRAA